MTVLRHRFEDRLAAGKARDQINTVKQGHHLVAEYTEEFQDLACHLNWPKES